MTQFKKFVFASFVWSLLLSVGTLALAQETPPVRTRQTVVLLTSSLDFERSSLLNRPYDERIARELRAHWDGRYEVIIKTRANTQDLHQALSSPRNVAVIWMSHAGGQGVENTGLRSGTIPDYQGFDVRDAFQEIHPNLRFLAVIGCRSFAGLLQQLRDHGLYERNPLLSVNGFDGKVEPLRGLRTVLALSDRILAAPAVTDGYEEPCEPRWGYHVRVSRYLPGHASLYPAARIMSRGQLLGSFPASSEQGYQTTEIFLPETLGHSAHSLKLVLDAGNNPHLVPREAELGELHLAAWEGAHWTPFTAAGVTSRIYRFDGALPEAAGAIPALYLPFECAPVRPL